MVVSAIDFIFESTINGSSNPAGYQNAINGLTQSGSVSGGGATPGQSATNAPNQVTIEGAHNATSTSASISGQLIFKDFQAGVPGDPNSGVPDVWTGKDVQNYTTAFGGLLDFSHSSGGAASTAQFGVRFPYLVLNNMPTTPCDAPVTGYSGHEGWLNFIAGNSGVADALTVCTKNAGGTYTWKSILPATVFTGKCTAPQTPDITNGITTGCS
jgi:hypothetical protein